jgi:RNA polymerase sigma-70 factor, ECF subfamily
MAKETEKDIDFELMKAIQRGDMVAFNSMVDRYKDRLMNVIGRMLSSTEEAEDIVQEVMIRIYQDKESRRHVDQPASYAFRMVYNACIDHLRKKAKNNFGHLNGKDTLAVDDSNREKEIIAREEFSRINKLLNSIPDEQADVLRLRIIDEMSFVEIAEIMKVPVTTIKSRFSYGISKLRTKVNHQEVKYELH